MELHPPPTMPSAGPPPRPRRNGQVRPHERGWVCAGCGRGYAPWARECTSCGLEDPEPPPATPILAVDTGQPAAVNLRLPGETAEPNYQRKFAANAAWKEVWPGLQCRSDGPPGSANVYVSFRLTPESDGERDATLRLPGGQQASI